MASLTKTHAAYVSGGRPTSLVGRAYALLGLYSTRQSLARLDDAMLEDIGLTRDEARKEARRWDVPSNWRG